MSHLAWYFFANAYASLGMFGHLRVRSLVWEARAFVQVRFFGPVLPCAVGNSAFLKLHRIIYK